jgi:hypothetical protein
MKDLEIVEKEPMSDFIIKQYLPDARIFKYSKFKNYKSINDILPNNKDYVIILNEIGQPNNGHWTAICKFNNSLQYFDAYGDKPSSTLTLNDDTLNNKLGQNKEYLNKLINDYQGDAYYNDFRYQELADDINTCGRHTCFFILCMLKHNYNLNQYYKFMKRLKQNSDENFDNIVSYMINLTNNDNRVK